MDLSNDPIGQKVEAEMKALRNKNVSIPGTHNYNRVFESFYTLHTEIERLNGLIEKSYDYGREYHFPRNTENTWQQFKTDNNL